ncbi:MAG: hypothetical protein U0M96_02440 [Eggerthellaceae bacterium]
MILFPEKEYSQKMLEALNYIAYGFYESAIDYLIDETDEDCRRAELEEFFPPFLLYQDADRCFAVINELYDWCRDEHYHPLPRIHEYALMRSVHSGWMDFNELPDHESIELRNSFYSPINMDELSEDDKMLIELMKNDELTTMQALFEELNFGELELLSSFYEKPVYTFLRFD